MPIIFNFTNYGFCDAAWEAVPGIEDPDLKEVAADYDNKGVIYAAGAKTLYRTDDSGAAWQAVFSVQANDDVINFVKVFEQGVFICTKNGVFTSSDGKSNWRSIFKPVGEKENNVSHAAFLNDKGIYLATGKGLFISNDNGLKWSRDNPGGTGLDVKWIEFLGDTILIAAGKGVYKNSGSGWKRTFVTTREDAEYDAAVTDESLEAVKPVNSIAIDKGSIFLATDSGIFISADKGETWKSFINAGLISLAVKRILCADSLYAVTDKGVFVFSDKDKLWVSLYEGMPTKEANSIAVDSDGNIWVATKKGLYERRQSAVIKPASSSDFENEKRDVLKNFKGEPVIGDVQKAAIEYAEVHPDKIKKWRDAAKKKALLPNVSFGLDRNSTDLWHWETGSTAINQSGDDLLRRGRDSIDWDVTMTWDLGDCIWNQDRYIPTVFRVGEAQL